ncbi:MAG: Dabb family protein [Nocardioidaceae bacterium]
MSVERRPRRLVLMGIDSEADAAVVRAAHRSFLAIPGVRCLSAAGSATPVGEATSPYTHVSVFEFDDADSRTAYHHHPIHTSARDKVRAHVSTVLVVDLD